jgi:DNA-binding transcriptional LysR family regulator
MLTVLTPADEPSVVTIGANESVATYLLPPPLAALRERLPGGHFQVVTGTCAEIRRGIGDGALDLGLVLEPWHAKANVLVTTRLLVLAGPRHPLASRRTPAALLARQTFYLSDVAGSFHRLLRRYFREAGFPAPAMEAVGSVEAVKRTVTSGECLGVLPAFSVTDELSSRTMAAVTVEPPLPPIVLSALHPPKQRPGPAARELLGLLESTT